MNDEKIFENKLWGQISALTSGVLTSLLYELLSGSSYELDIEGKQYEIVSTGMSTWFAFGLVLLTFMGLWAIFSWVLPWLSKIRKRFVYDKVKKTTAKELIKVLDEAKRKIKELYPFFAHQEDAPIKEDIIVLHGRELAMIISLLHRKFLPKNKRLRKRVEQYFRHSEHATITTIAKHISAYELAADIALLKSMVAQLKKYAGRDALLNHDCTEMEGKLNDLAKMKVLASMSAPKDDTCTPRINESLIDEASSE